MVGAATAVFVLVAAAATLRQHPSVPVLAVAFVAYVLVLVRLADAGRAEVGL